MNDKDKQESSLLERADQLHKAASSANDGVNDSYQSTFSIWKEKLSLKFPFLAFIIAVLTPIFKLVAFVFALLCGWFSWAAYVKEEKSEIVNARGDELFSAKQFITRMLITLSVIVFLHALVSATYFYSTRFSEVVYVTGKQEIETGEIYQFGGCTALPCSTSSDNGKFYLIETSIYFPRLIYPEEDVFANIPQQNAACSVEGYGLYFRSLRWIYKSAQLYQHVYSVSCRPYTDEELDKAIGAGIGS